MRYLSESDVTQMMGIGYLGEVRQGPDGHVYQYVQGVDGLGNPIGGFWSKVKGVLKAGHRLAQRGASFIPGPYGAAIRTGLNIATPLLQKAGVAGYEGIGALYEAPDGNIYQVHGLEGDDELHGIDEDQMTQMMGIGYLGEVRQAPDGNLYQYMQGVDGLGNLTGFWGKLKRLGSRALQYHPAAWVLKAASPYIRKALPIAQQVASVIPGGAAALTAAAPILKEAGVAGYNGIGALYQAPDGTLHQLQGFADNEDLRGLDADDELHGFDGDDELHGFAADDELQGLDEDMDLHGFDADDDLHGFDEDQDIHGIDGYVRQDGMNGLERYEPDSPPQTRWHVASSQPPEVWKTLW